MFAPIQTYDICTTRVQDKDHVSQTSSKKSKQPHPSANAVVSTRKKSRHARSSFMANGSQQGAVTTCIEKMRRHGHARPGHSTMTMGTMGHGHSSRRPGHSGMARAFRHGHARPRHSLRSRPQYKAFTAFTATVYFFISLGRGQGVHGHGMYGQATAKARATHALATCVHMRACTHMRTEIAARVPSLPCLSSQLPWLRSSKSMAFWSKPSWFHFTRVSRVGWTIASILPCVMS